MSQPFDPITLDLVLWDYSPDMHVRAILEADGLTQPISPVVIPHKSSGRYVLYDPPNIYFPDNVSHYAITYEVFKDSGFTQRSLTHAPYMEHYTKDNPIPGGDPEVIEKLNQVIDIVTSHDVNSQIVGVLQEEFELVGVVMPEDVIGVAFDDITLVGLVLDEGDTGGDIFDNDDLTGTIN